MSPASTSPDPASLDPASPSPASPGPTSPDPASPGPLGPGPTSPASTSAEPARADLDLLYTDVEDSLRGSLRDLLTARCTPDRVVAGYDGDRSLTPALWKSLAVDLGLAGLLVPEERGGAGAGPREAAVVLEELGRFVAPVPFLTSAVVATTALLCSEDASLLGELASGERTAALVVPLHHSADSFGADSFGADSFGRDRSSADSPGADRSGADRSGRDSSSTDNVRTGVRADDEGRLSGRVTSVAGALDADVLLVPVAAGAGIELHIVEAASVDVEPVVSLDMTRPLADIALTGVRSTRVLTADRGASAIREALEVGAALVASEQLGVAQWCLDQTIGYLRDRKQFGRPVGGFQAIKHRLADLWVRVESAGAAARYAAATAAAGDADREVAASVAQAYCSDVAVLAAEECLQLHGGIGMTWEHPAHLYLKRAKADQIAFGTPGAHRRRLGELVDLPVVPG